MSVQWLKMFTALALLALWLPATNHCRLEQIPGLAFLTCCDDAEEAAPADDRECESDGCDPVENGLYKSENHTVELAAPVCVFADFLLPLPAGTVSAPAAGRELPGAAPPEVSRAWQFSFRAAAPPRAPSFAS